MRRLLVLGIALALVFGIGRLLGGGPAQDDDPSAQPAAATASSATPSMQPSASAAPVTRAGRNDRPVKVRTPLAVPTGPCLDDDVRVVPSVDGTAYAGNDVTVTLNLSTSDSPACTWEVSPESVVVKLTSGSDRIWSTQDCPGAVPRQQVTLRRDSTTTVGVVWSGQRSDPSCSRTTSWAEPGFYHASAAALGSEPEDRQFQLAAPQPATITPSPTPEPTTKS